MADPTATTTAPRTVRSGRRRRVAHLTTVDMSLALLLATELAVDVAAGLDVVGMSAPGPYVPQVEALGVRHVAVPALGRAWSPADDARAARQLWRALREVRPDVLHTHTPKAGVLGRLLGHAAGVPVVVNTCHGLWASPDDRPVVRAAVHAVEAVAARFGDAELYQNATDLTAMRRLGTRHQRLVGNGTDLARFHPDVRARRATRAALGVADDVVLVGGVGRRVAEKGIGEFAALARRLAGAARFVWVGPADPAKPDAVAGDLDGVELLGARDDMAAVYPALDVFVLPSHREGFSRSAMEAAASGCAIVLTDIRGCREIGVDGRDLLLVPARDPDRLAAAVGRLVDDAALRRRFGAAARRRALASFDQRRVAAASLATYDAVAARKGLGWPALAPASPFVPDELAPVAAGAPT